MLLVFTTESLLFVVFTAIVWYEFFFSMSALEFLVTLRVLLLLGGIYMLVQMASEWMDVEDCGEEAEDAKSEEDDAKVENVVTLCKTCSHHVREAMASSSSSSELKETISKEGPPASPVEASDEFADLLEPATKQIPSPKVEPLNDQSCTPLCT